MAQSEVIVSKTGKTGKASTLVGIAKLRQGLKKFHQELVTPHTDFFTQLGEGQKPQAMFITCSDSRVDPNLMTQSMPGELFVIRNAGAIIPAYDSQVSSGEAATIEYAVRVLEVEHIVVCGHSHCGAMSALAEEVCLDKLPAMEKWLSHAQPKRLRRSVSENMEAPQRLDVTIRANVALQLENLRSHPAVREGLQAKTLMLHGWVYNIETGSVCDYDPAVGFVEKMERWGHASQPPRSDNSNSETNLASDPKKSADVTLKAVHLASAGLVARTA
jgi:carbonic anhydrase